MKKIILNVRRHYGEIDWILPILYHLRRNYKIYTVFDSKFTFDNFKKNKTLYLIWKKINEDFYILDFKKSFFFRLVNKLTNIFFLNKLLPDRTKQKINCGIFNINDIFKKFNINKKNLKFFFVSVVSLNNFSTTIKNEILNCKIIRFPESTWLFPNRRLNKRMNIYNYKNQTSDFYLFSHLNDKNFFFNNDQAINKKSFLCGYPRYQKNWINLIIKNNKKKSNNNFKIVVATRKWEKNYLPFVDYKKSILDIMSFSRTIENSKVFFKLHPHSHEEIEITKILKNNRFTNWKIVYDHPMNLAKDANLCISMITSVTFDFLSLNKPTIEFYHSKNLTLNERSKSAVHVVIEKNRKYKTIFKYYNLVKSAESYNDLIDINRQLLKNKKFFYNEFKSFRNLTTKFNVKINKIIKELENI